MQRPHIGAAVDGPGQPSSPAMPDHRATTDRRRTAPAPGNRHRQHHDRQGRPDRPADGKQTGKQFLHKNGDKYLMYIK